MNMLIFGEKKFLHFILYTAATILLIFLHTKTFLYPVENLIIKISSPFLETSSSVSYKTVVLFRSVLSFREIVARNKELTDEIQELKIKMVKLRELRRENEFLRKELSLAPIKQRQLKLARLIEIGNQGMSRYIIINEGSDNGLRKGDAVTVSGGIIVGRITEIFDKFSKVILLNDDSSKINVMLQDSRSEGIAHGGEGGELMMDFITQKEEIGKGDVVITSGLGGVLPPGLLVGTVKEIVSSDTEPFQIAKIAPAADYSFIESVFVITQ